MEETDELRAAYLQAVEEHSTSSSIGVVNASVWHRFSEAEPGVDFTRIFPFVEDSAEETT